MKKVAVVTDSNSGISQEEARKLGCFVVPMPFIIDGEEFFEGLSLNQNQFYQIQASGKKITTSQPNINEVVELWKKFSKIMTKLCIFQCQAGFLKAAKPQQVLHRSLTDEFRLWTTKEFPSPCARLLLTLSTWQKTASPPNKSKSGWKKLHLTVPFISWWTRSNS